MMTMNIGSFGNYTNTNEAYNTYSYDGYYQNFGHAGTNDMAPFSSTSADNTHYQPSYYNCQEFKDSFYIKNDKPVYQKSYDEMVHRKHCDGEGIITSDNGLSYTNLDSYQLHNNNNNKRNFKSDKVDDKTNWYVNEDFGQYVQCNASEFENFNLHYIKDDYQSEAWNTNHMADGLYAQAAQHPRHGRLQHMVSSHQNNVGKTVPTYKWMQVKRNVPKPNGKPSSHVFPAPISPPPRGPGARSIYLTHRYPPESSLSLIHLH
ncbi:UNVERIFIED_CONTAM: hypothetical protein PYX00_008515 [Menopon gallinae]|uniref:Uncharacterized protein n=1 Tax=Menopon gallinae TaxID=328185 RepID=A0AAW2HN98_9NEOP